MTGAESGVLISGPGTLTVMGAQTFEVPAGTFGALKVVLVKDETDPDSSSHDTTTLWLARGW